MTADQKKGRLAMKKRVVKQNMKNDKVRMVRRTVGDHLEDNRNIYTLAQVQKLTEECTGFVVSQAVVSRELHKNFGMRYRKIREIAFQGNNERNLALRCMFAQEFLKVLAEGKRIINIDETWLNQLEFNRFKWCKKGEVNSMRIKGVSPRISMIVALATTGEVYCSLT